MSSLGSKLPAIHILLVLGYVALGLALAGIVLLIFRIILYSHRMNTTPETELAVLDELEPVPIFVENEDDFVAVRKQDLNECMICLEHFDAESPLANTMCGHAYHLHCISQWASNSCPSCRNPLS